MWEVFKILLLCLISVFIATLTTSWLYVFVILLVIIVFLYDFDFTTGIERHAITKLKYSYLKVRNLYTAIFQRDQNNSSFQYTPTMNSINKQTTSFELSRFNKSGNPLSPITNSSNSGTYTSRRLIQPRQTSTPLTRTSPWQKNSISSPTNHARSATYRNSIVNRSPRYSLSSLTPKSLNNESPSTPTIQTVTGPLLASTRFNVNLGTYTDTKSPGLASRVVQYHNELSGSQTSTHQTRYGSPGQFPIVQLYKKDLPILGRPARRCTVRIAPPDPVSYNSDHANTILRDSFVQNNENTNRQNDTEINTRSVLEALKEISRKRIHTNDDLDDISKRQRKNSVSSTSNSAILLNKDGKRMREDTPPKPKESCTTPVNSAPKRICVVNEIESSLSSSRLMRLQQGQKRKSSLSTPETNKQRRMSNGELVSRETQTTIINSSKSSVLQNINKDTQKTTSTAAQTENEVGNGIQMILDSTRRKKKPNEVRSIRDIDEENSTLQFAKSNVIPTKSIFSEAPLEIMKQNKLSVMLSALGGNEPEIIPLPNMTLSALKKKSEDHPDGTDIINKEVVSILSPKNKIKHDKHVTFAIQSSDKTNDLSSGINYIETVNQTNSLPVVLPVSTSNANSSGISASFSAPSTSINFSSPITFGTNVSNSLTFSAASTVGSNVTITSNNTGNNVLFGSVLPSASKVIMNDVTTTTNSTNIITSSSTDKAENTASNSMINFGSTSLKLNFGSPDSVKSSSFGGLVPSSIVNTATKNALNKIPSAGFQFSSTTSVPTVSNALTGFGSSPVSSSAIFTPSPSATLSTSSLPTINFGAKSPAVTTSATSGINFGAVGSQQPASSLLPTNSSFTALAPVTTTISSGMFNFGAKTEPKSTSSNFSFGSPTPTTQSQAKPGGFKFDLGKSVANSSASASKPELVKTPSFGAAAAGSSTLNKSGAFAFGASNTVTTSTTAFSTTSTPVFGVQSTSTPSFGATNKTISTGMFGAPTTTSATGVFGSTSTTTSGGAFGASGTTLSSGTFGTPSTTTSTASFGAATNTGIFGTTPPSSAFTTPKSSENPPSYSAFGATGSAQNPSFGTTPQSTTFGFNTPTTTQNNAFGGTPATTTSSFTFGTNAPTKPFAFGSTTTATTTAPPPMFGSTSSTSATNLFGGAASSGFGGVSATTNAFGGGTPATTAQNTFGQQSSTGVFGTASSGFGSGTSGPVFGTNNNNNNNAFGSSTSSNVFGASTQQPQPNTFGAGTATQQQQPNSFGTGTATQQQQPSTFGTGTTTQLQQSNTFGTGTASQQQQPSTFGTGTATQQQQPSTFGTGTATQQQQPSTFGTGTATQGNVFGASNNNQGTGVFGATNSNTNTFGSTSNASFGGGFSNNNAQSSGIGNFGSPASQTPSQSSGIFAFGNAAQPSSSTPTAANAFQFGAGNQTPKQSGFNFSTNASTPNINFGSGAPPPFSATSAPTPTFGTPGPGQFNAPAPATGMFNIGSGSTAPKQRPMIKARRRN